jgi:hypothetical protein
VTEPLHQLPPETEHAPVDPEHELARKNLVWGWTLFALYLVLFGGTVAVAFIYLQFD